MADGIQYGHLLGLGRFSIGRWDLVGHGLGLVGPVVADGIQYGYLLGLAGLVVADGI